MKKRRIEKRLANAVQAFLAEEKNYEFQPLAVRSSGSVLTLKENKAVTEKLEDWIAFLKKAFLFLPGTFILYFTTFAAVYFHQTMGFTWQMAFWFSAGGFMVWSGLGELKNFKHLVIPASIVAFSLFLSVIFSFLPHSMKASMFFQNSIYFFPIALMLPNILKKWLLEKSIDSIS